MESIGEMIKEEFMHLRALVQCVARVSLTLNPDYSRSWQK
jgi:hypothetical protein